MYREMNILTSERILIVTPHPDDESIGVGGLLSKYGAQCDILLLTDGRKGVSPLISRTEDEIATIRKREFDEAICLFGVRKCTNLKLLDQTVLQNRRRIYEYSIREYDYVFVPNRHEKHMDHKVLYKIFQTMKLLQGSKAKIIEYEVWTPIAKPNYFLDISDVMANKIKAISQYECQLESYDYVAMSKGLNTYRGALQQVEFCEAYYSKAEARKNKTKKQMLRLWGTLPKGIRNQIKKVWNRGNI